MADAARVRVFLGVPAVLAARQQKYVEQWIGWLENHAVEVIRLQRDAYSGDPWSALMSLLSRADGTILLGFRQLDARAAIWRPCSPEKADGVGWWTSPWLQLEAGLAIAVGHPVLVAPEDGVEEGVFAPGAWGGQVRGAPLSSPGEAGTAWLESVRRHAVSTKRAPFGR
jgi:hypothetical protein